MIPYDSQMNWDEFPYVYIYIYTYVYVCLYKTEQCPNRFSCQAAASLHLQAES